MSQLNFTITVNKDATSLFWNEPPKQASLADIKDLLSTPDIRDDKDGLCFIPGEFQGNRRSANAMMSIDMLVYDVDGHQTLQEALEKLTAAGVYALVYTTFSHRTNRTLIHTNHYDEWAKKNGLPSAATKENVLKYLDAKKKGHLKNVEFDPSDSKYREFNAKGLHIVVFHDPLDKFRVVLPLASPIPVATLSYTTKQSIAEWKSIYHGVGQELGLAYDPACEDPSRVHYMPACSKSNEDKFDVFQLGDPNDPVLLDWTKYPRVKTADKKAERGEVRRAPRDATTVTDKNGVPIDLVAWERDHANFDIETCLETHLAAEDLKDPRAKGGFHITCPNEADHSEPGGLGCFAANRDEEHGWTINCRHAGCAGRNRLDHLRALIEQGVLTAADIGIAAPVTVADLTSESTPEQITAALETLARSKPGRVELNAKLDEIGQKLGKPQARYKANLAADYKTIAARQAKPEKAPRAVSADRLNLIDHALLFETDGETPDQTRERVRRHIEARNRQGTPVVYKRGVHPVRLRRDTKSGLKVETMNATTFAAEVERWTVWGETRKDKSTKTTGCPLDIAEKLRTDPALDVPPLTDIRNAPFYTREGQLVASPGYHAESGVFYDPEGLDVGEIPDVPTEDEVRAAVALVRKPYAEFPFHDGVKDPAGRSSRANIIARDVTAFVREMVDCVPMYLLDKTSHGAGGTLLANVGSIIATGKKAAVDTIKKDSYGWQQAFHSHALAGTSRILIDNVPKGYLIEDTNIAAYGTASRLEGRILGKSEVGGGDVRWILEWTGVNLGFSQENARRSVMVRIDPATSAPGERGFDIDDLEGWTLENRSALVRAHLILVQNWIAKGRPEWTGKALASFERWSRIVGGILEVAGIKGFDGNRYLLEGKDSEAMRDFVQLWFDTFGAEPVRVGKVDFDFAPDNGQVDTLTKLYVGAGDEVYLGVSRKSKDLETLSGRLGNKLTEVSGGAYRVETDTYSAHVVSHDYRIEKCERDKHGVAYRLAPVGGTMRIGCRVQTTCSPEQSWQEFAHLEAIRADSL